MRRFLWTALIAVILFILLILSIRYLGETFTVLIGLAGLGGAGVISEAKKEARRKHETVAAAGDDAVTNDNLDMLRRHNDPR